MGTATADAGPAALTGQPAARRPRRSGQDKMPTGVAGGIARSLDADVTLVRGILAAPALCTGTGAAGYIAAWLLVPADGDGQPAAGTVSLHPDPHTARPERRPITMSGIIAVALIVIAALTALSLAVHVLFSPWLLAAIAVLAWLRFRPRRSHR